MGRADHPGTLVLADADNGVPLAVMDAGSVTALRTGAATAVAAMHLARPDAHTVTLVGCGAQGQAQLASLAVPAGIFVAAVGADSQGTQELDPTLVASATLVVDVLEQCAEIGERSPSSTARGRRSRT